MEPHDYTFTVAGRCARCQLTEQEHVPLLADPNPMTGCPANHNALSTHLLINDGGWEWRRCPYCGVMVEGALRTGTVVGPEYGPGRGELRVRQMDRLAAWRGWVAFNGGDA